MEQLKQVAKMLGINIDKVEFTDEFIKEKVAEADEASTKLFDLAKNDPDNAPSDEWAYIRAHVGCYTARLLQNAAENPLNFPEKDRLETLKSLLTLYELNNRTATLAQSIVTQMVIPQCVDKKISEAKVIKMLKEEFDKQKKLIPTLAELKFEDQLATEHGKRSFDNTMYYFTRIAGIYYMSRQ